jgi:S-adenosylmethionine decarboxylase
MQEPNNFGRHLIMDIWGEVNSLPFWNMDEAAEVLIKAVEKAGAKVITHRWHHFGDGFGYTGVIVLSNSHLSIHTWPERGFAAIDVYFCDECNPRDVVEFIEDYFKPTHYTSQTLVRGSSTI